MVELFSAQAFNDEEHALHAALKPLIGNEDGHFVAAVISLVQSLLEGRTDVPSVVSLVLAKLCLQLHDCWPACEILPSRS